MEKMKSCRNTRKVIKESSNWAMLARSKFLMHNEMVKREKKQILLSNGKWVTEFINCSYLGLDVKNEVVDAYKKGVDDLGIGFCAARTRLSTASNGHLEKSLSDLWEGHAIVFPSVTSTHHSVMPLISSGCFWQRENVRLIFDKFSHSSMQTLIPILSEEAEVVIICHNDIDALKVQIKEAEKNNQLPVYVSDGIYSMGGHCPVNQIEDLLENTDLHWYVDDAHGTSIYGKKGEGYILERLS